MKVISVKVVKPTIIAVLVVTYIPYAGVAPASIGTKHCVPKLRVFR